MSEDLTSILIDSSSELQSLADKEQNCNTNSGLAIKDSIQRRCAFMATAFTAPESFTAPEWLAVAGIWLRANNNRKVLHDEIQDLPKPCKELLKSPDTEFADIPPQPSCEKISEVTRGCYCDHCQFWGIVNTPLELGYRPWNTNKRVMLLASHLDEEIRLAEAVLATSPDVFYRGDRLVHVIGNTLKAAPGSNDVVLEIHSITPAKLQEMLSERFFFIKTDSEKGRPIYPPKALVSGLLDRAFYPNTRQLRGITNVPVLRPDGTVLQAAGYDPATEILFQPNREFPMVPEFPTTEEVQNALRELLDVVADFPFTSDIGRAVFLSTILSVVGRFAFQGCTPMVIIDANTPGVGKTKLADVIGLITTGQPIPRSAQAECTKEERRQITSILRQGDRLLLIDNIASRFGSSVLDMLLTSEVWQDRILGRSKEVAIPNLLQVIATGNNIQLKADTVRRCIRIQLSSPDEHPETRSDFRHPNLEAWVTDHQPRLLTAALTVLRGYIVAGKPPQNLVTLGSFAGWSTLIQSTVQWAYRIDPGLARITQDDAMDFDTEILERLMRGWRKFVPEGSASSCRKVMEAVLKDPERGQDILEAMEMKKPSARRGAVTLGSILTFYRSRRQSGAYFDRFDNERNSEGLAWRLMPIR